jgi:hypothetical protein
MLCKVVRHECLKREENVITLSTSIEVNPLNAN